MQQSQRNNKSPMPDPLVAKAIDQLSANQFKTGKFRECRDLLLGSQSLHPILPHLHTRLLKTLCQMNDDQALAAALDQGRDSSHLLLETLQFQASTLQGSALEDALAEGTESALKLTNQAALDFIASANFRILLDKRSKEMGVDDAERVRLWWWEKPYPGNLGDILNPYLIEAITGIPPKYANQGPRMFACGSILRGANADVTVWGSGAPRRQLKLDPKATYLAVRGPISREIVINSGGSCPEVYGDPALLLPLIYTPKVKDKSPPCGLILHHNHSHTGLEIDANDVETIPITCVGFEQIEQFIDLLTSKQCVFSTSLHGIIIAHAYGLPAVWCSLKGQAADVPGDGMKFYDYFQSVGIGSDLLPVELSSVKVIDQSLCDRAIPAPSNPDMRPLLSAFPHRIKNEKILELLGRSR